MSGPSNRRRRAGWGIARFVALFGVYLLLGHFLVGLAWVEETFVEPWTDLNVRGSVFLSRASGLDARSDGRMLEAPGARLEVNRGCDGITAVIILSSAILAFPASWPHRLVGLLAGWLALWAVNSFRLMTLLVVAVRWPERLDLFHVDVWQPAMILISFGLFLLWGGLLAHASSRRILGSSGPAS